MKEIEKYLLGVVIALLFMMIFQIIMVGQIIHIKHHTKSTEDGVWYIYKELDNDRQNSRKSN